MEVLNFMNTNSNWEEVLTKPPYCVTVKRDEDYILLKYNQLSSDFSIPIVQECRGSIFYQNKDGKYECVCRAFDKFFNQGEGNAAEIDWYSVVVEEKVDGSLMKVWYHNNQWHVSTNSNINAYKAEVGETSWTFGRLFDNAIKNIFPSAFFNGLDKNMVHMFELVSPRSMCTVAYPETRLYYLGSRNMNTMMECKVYPAIMSTAEILYPKVYELYTLDCCQKYINTMTKDEEGFVIRDKHYNRIKLKSPAFLMAFHMNNNGIITTKRVIKMIQNEQIDDFLAYCPHRKEIVEEVLAKLNNLAARMDETWQLCADVAAKCDREVFACYISKLPYKDYLYNKYDNHDLRSMNYILTRTMPCILRMLEGSK